MKLHRVFNEKGSLHGYFFECPGCGELHCVGPSWAFNGDMDRPTFSPSILVRWGSGDPKRCHSFIRDGRIEFCSDSTHALAGKTVDLPEIEGFEQTSAS